MTKKERIKNLNKIKTKQNFLQIILSFIFVYFIFYFSGYSAIFRNENFYKNEFEKYKIFQQFPNDDILLVNQAVIEYLKPANYRYKKFKNYLLPSLSFFNESEKSHLKDVRILFSYMSAICLIFLVILVLLFRRNRLLLYFKSLWISSIISLSLIAVLCFGIFFNFDYLFSGMHHIFFEPGTWTFDSSVSNMVNLYPLEFFMDFAIEIGKKIIITSLFLFFISLFAIRFKRKLL